MSYALRRSTVQQNAIITAEIRNHRMIAAANPTLTPAGHVHQHINTVVQQGDMRGYLRMYETTTSKEPLPGTPPVMGLTHSLLRENILSGNPGAPTVSAQVDPTAPPNRYEQSPVRMLCCLQLMGRWPARACLCPIARCY